MNTLFPMTQLIDAAFRTVPANGERDGARVWREMPRADILEGEKDFIIRMNVPGVEAKDLEISLENRVLTVKAERDIEFPEGYKAHRREMPAKISLSRSFNLGDGVEADQIGAKLESGVLTVTLPKAEQNLPRQIEVK
jgi:HSP20 family protein